MAGLLAKKILPYPLKCQISFLCADHTLLGRFEGPERKNEIKAKTEIDFI